MKRSILCATVLCLGLASGAVGTAANDRPAAHEHLLCTVDDPPPEPVDCPLCGGNAQVHARRLILIAMQMNRVAAAVTRW